MSTPRKISQAAPPSDRVRIGAFIVDLALREIGAADGIAAPVRITVKAQGVLLALIAKPGKVVSREALLDEVWPDTAPGDDVVTQAIIQLRKAFGDSRKQTSYIETISKHGYRMIADVEWLPAREATEPEWSVMTTAPATPDARPQPRVRSSRRSGALSIWTLSVVGILLLLSWSAYRLMRRSPAADAMATTAVAERSFADPATFQRIASLPENERSPNLSPDGAMLVYAREAKDGASVALMLQMAAPLPPKPLTAHVPGRSDMMPRWSPDGLQIAFVRFEPPRCTIMLAPSTGGSERELGPCISHVPEPINWYPDGRALIGVGQPEADDPARLEGLALYRMPLATGRWERVPYARNPTDVDNTPSVSPDGRWIAFHRNATIGELWRVPVGGGAPQQLTHMHSDVAGLAWTPDSRALIFSRERNGRRILSKLEIADGRLRDFSLPGAHLTYPSVAVNSGAVAFQITDVRETILRLRVAQGERALPGAAVVAASNGANRIPALSPDNAQLVFASDRTGQLLLWWQETADPDSLRPIEGFVPRLSYPPDWNPTSERIVAVGEGAQGRGIYEILPRSGRVEFLGLPESEPIQALYHPDPERLLVVGGDRQGRMGLTLYDRRTQPWKTLARIDDVIAAVVDRGNRRIVFGRRSKSEIVYADLDLLALDSVDRLNEIRRQRTLTPTTDGVWAMDVDPDCSWYWRRIADVGATHAPKGVCLGKDKPLPLDAIPAYDEARGEIYLSPLEALSVDIGYLPSASGKR